MFGRSASLLLLLDVFLAVTALVTGSCLRRGSAFGDAELERLAYAAPTFALICIIVFPACGLYTTHWRYPSLRDILRIPRAAIVASTVFVGVIFFVSRLEGFSRLAIVIEVFVLIVMLGLVRLAFRADELSPIGKSEDISSPGTGKAPALIVGSDRASAHFIRALARDPESTIRPVGLLDNDPARRGMTVHGVPVLGGLSDAESIIGSLGLRGNAPQHIIFSEPLSNYGDGEASSVIESADRLGLVVSRLPRSTDLRDPRKHGRFDLCPIQLSDLLGRPQAALDNALVEKVVTGRRVLVTGAGGSIGSELSQQLAALTPSELLLLDNSEYNLYQIDRKLRESYPADQLTSLICDVRDAARVNGVFDRFQPELIFHAAALKHVPIVELNPAEGVLTNIVGSRNVANAARRVGALATVQISTDKAVNTTNVMGATKRVAELYCQALDIAGWTQRSRRTRFMTVRFGNVLGSSGSLVPLLQRQIAHGGPVTVTHPEMRRFFMTVQEAVELTLQASAHGLEARTGQGEIFVLDMGEPVRIIDIARRLIRLAGLTPDEDIPIQIIGVRPGEKLFEELFDVSEKTAEAQIDGVIRAVPRPLPLRKLNSEIAALERAARVQDTQKLFTLLRSLVAGYEPSDDTIQSDGPLMPPVKQRGTWFDASLVETV